MKQQTDDACILPHDKDEINAIFRRYDFRDELGHPLLLCSEFVQLVDAYCKAGGTSKEKSDARVCNANRAQGLTSRMPMPEK